MKFYLIVAVIAISLSSCLKESIADAMLASKNAGAQRSAATLSYEINGNAVNISVNDADNRNGSFYTLGCSKYAGYYSLDAVSSSGEFTFTFYTDSLATGNYKYTGAYGDMFITDYNGTNEYVHAVSNSMSFNITSYANGRISGNFSGVLTPMIAAGNPNNIYGTPGSVLITNGSFENVPLFY
ncbi:hypothetical protein FC093_09345 [Ilyomonas limi]|uniref:Lipoprotein n=1 Tax=Ilyomonas limi TaxID=2575867 RepID=A0A4U3L222_9BACT|nr:hypothetical protein [Ilyomonas limi]TKK68892.1 hypothetical protein FC093_09345 [Ilyomonas limi]